MQERNKQRDDEERKKETNEMAETKRGKRKGNDRNIKKGRK